MFYSYLGAFPALQPVDRPLQRVIQKVDRVRRSEAQNEKPEENNHCDPRVKHHARQEHHIKQHMGEPQVGGMPREVMQHGRNRPAHAHQVKKQDEGHRKKGVHDGGGHRDVREYQHRDSRKAEEIAEAHLFDPFGKAGKHLIF